MIYLLRNWPKLKKHTRKVSATTEHLIEIKQNSAGSIYKYGFIIYRL